MPDPSGQEPEWFKKFKEANSKAAEPAVKSGDSSSTRSTGGGAERRRHLRFDLGDTAVTLYREGLLSYIGVGRENKAKVAVNLSEGGIQVIGRERFNVGAKVRIKLEIEQFKDAITASGVIRWCFQNARRKDDFHIGIQFDDLEGAEGRKIASMREWFTDPSLRAKRESKTRIEKGGLKFPT